MTIIYAGSSVESDILADMAARHRIDGMIVRQGLINDTVLGASDRLVVLSRHGAGVDRIDLAAATRRGIPVLRAAGANANSVAELTIGLVYALVKEFARLDKAVRAGLWPKPGYVGRDITGLKLGLIGYGAVGRYVADMARQLGMIVGVYDPRATIGEGLVRAGTLEDLLEECDVLSLHCPLTRENWHMIDARAIARMRKGSFLINTARGGLVDELALVDALTSGKLSGAALDSYADEPPPTDHPLWQVPNLIVTPHIAGAGRSGMKAMAIASVNNLLDAMAGNPLPRTILANPEVIDRLPARTRFKFA